MLLQLLFFHFGMMLLLLVDCLLAWLVIGDVVVAVCLFVRSFVCLVGLFGLVVG